ncbi:MAG: hypothetical protein KGI29_05905 [Pseudomonadota bacterium]|nr:hypothetical protein [Pseudomonadota bacterium]MDE3037673.1 hypothetical protein [Pseudomonadota bacterium]
MRLEKRAAKDYSTVLIAVTFLICLWIQTCTLPGTDIGWLVWGTGQMMGGAVLYKDIIESNPPLIYWLYAIPVELARHFAWPPVTTLRIATMALIAAILPLCGMILQSSVLWRAKESRSFLLAIAVLLLWADSFFIFAQREHLLVVLLLPYVLLNLPSVSCRKAAAPFCIAIGLLAGLGLCLKPFFFIIWFAMLLYKFRHGGSARGIFQGAEAAIVLVALCYAASVGIFAPHYFGWLKIGFRIFTASGYLGESKLSIAVWFAGLAAAGMAVAWAFGLFRLPPAARYASDVRYLIWVAAASYTEALTQFKDWKYIPFPFFAFGMLAVVALILLKPVSNLLAIALMGWAALPITPLDDSRQDNYRQRYNDLMQVIEPYHADNWYLFSLFFAPPEFYVAARPQWEEEIYNFHFMLAGVMKRFPSTGQPTLVVQPGKEWIERWMLENISDTLEQKRPGLIVVERKWNKEQPVKESFDFTAWFTHDARLVGILRQYRLQKKVELCAARNANWRCTYAIYKREAAR